jgi:hypothetical protein
MAIFGDLAITKSVSGLDKTKVGLDKVDNTADVNKPVSTATQTELNKKENKFNVVAPLKKTYNVLSGTNDVSFDESSIQVDKFALGLDKVDNTSDADKPISDIAALLIGSKLPITNPVVTGRITAPTVNATDVNISGALILTGDTSVLTVENIQAPSANNINLNGSVKVLNSIFLHLWQALTI